LNTALLYLLAFAALPGCIAPPSLFATTSLWGYRICSKLGLVIFGIGYFGHTLSLFAQASESVVSFFSVTPIPKGDIYYPNYAWTAFPRLVCAEGYIVPERLNSEVQKSPYTLVQLKVALGFICDRLNLEAFPLHGDDYYSEFTTSPFTKTNSTWLSPSFQPLLILCFLSFVYPGVQ